MSNIIEEQISNAFLTVDANSSLIELVEQLSDSGLTRKEIYDAFHSFYAPLPGNDAKVDSILIILERLYGWCPQQEVLLPDEPINKLAILTWRQPGVRPEGSDDEYWNNLIHPEDLEFALKKSKSNIYFIGKTHGDYTTIKQFDKILRVRAKALKIIEHEGFYLGDKVQTKSNNGRNTMRQGHINDLFYNYKQEKLIYLLVGLGNRKITKQYFAEDLERLWQ